MFGLGIFACRVIDTCQDIEPFGYFQVFGTDRLFQKNQRAPKERRSLCISALCAVKIAQVFEIFNNTRISFSECLCGSAVTYRESVKQGWLDISAETLANYSAESLETTREMAVGVLHKTTEATFSAAVTGHLGPDAPHDIDGKIYVVVAGRTGDSIEIADSQAFRLTSSSSIDRQYEAATHVLSMLLVQLNA